MTKYSELVGMDIDDAAKKLGDGWHHYSRVTGVLCNKMRGIYEFFNREVGHLVLFTIENKVTSYILD